MIQADRRPSPLPWQTTAPAHTGAVVDEGVERGEVRAGNPDGGMGAFHLLRGLRTDVCLDFYRPMKSHKSPEVHLETLR